MTNVPGEYLRVPLVPIRELAERFGQDKETQDAIIMAIVTDRACWRAALGVNLPWPITDVLDRLVIAIDHLRDGHDCDCDGHEEILAARDTAERLRGYLGEVIRRSQ